MSISGFASAGLFSSTLVATLVSASASAVLAQGLALDTVGEAATGLVRPVVIAAPDDGSGRIFIAQQTGEILIADGMGGTLSPPFLDLSSEVTCCGERGLLGLAFHPDYSTNGEFFVDYTRTVDSRLETVVARYTVSAGDPDLADSTSEEILLTIDQPAANHNGGQLAFGPDGFLYVSTGDGGGGGDPNENGQALDTLLGKILRIDVDSTDPGLAYAVPADNPFVGATGARDEIWAYGLRNPWRASFDRGTGDLWIADVGQQDWEEIDLQPAGSSGGENYGWDCREGAHDYDDPNGDQNADCPADPSAAGLVDPVLEYFQENGRCSVTGGYRYRGDAEPRLRGVYLYADFCTGEIFGTVPRCDGVVESRVLYDAPFLVTAFGEDQAGELFVTEFVSSSSSATSEIHRLGLAPGSGGPDLTPSPEPIDFGTVEVGDTVSAVLTLTHDNAGPEAASITSTTLSDAARFALDPGAGSAPCRTLRPCLPAGASCTLGVELQAGSEDTISESVTHEGNFATEIVQLTAEIVPCTSAVNLDLTNLPVSGSETHRACDTLTAGTGVVVQGTGDLTLSAGTRVVLGDGFRVEPGGQLTLEVF